VVKGKAWHASTSNGTLSSFPPLVANGKVDFLLGSAWRARFEAESFADEVAEVVVFWGEFVEFDRRGAGETSGAVGVVLADLAAVALFFLPLAACGVCCLWSRGCRQAIGEATVKGRLKNPGVPRIQLDFACLLAQRTGISWLSWGDATHPPQDKEACQKPEQRK